MINTIILRRDKPADREKAARFLAKLPPNKPWRLEVSEYKPRRSDQQNRFLFGVVYREIMRHLEGWNIEDIHEYCLGEWAGWETVEGFGKKRLRPIRRSSRLNKQEFSDYLAFIQQRMAEHGIFIPDPEYGDTNE